MEITSKVASIDNECVSQEKRLAAYKGNMRNWRGELRKADCYAQCYDNSTNDIRPTEKTILKLKQIDK